MEVTFATRDGSDITRLQAGRLLHSLEKVLWDFPVEIRKIRNDSICAIFTVLAEPPDAELDRDAIEEKIFKSFPGWTIAISGQITISASTDQRWIPLSDIEA